MDQLRERELISWTTSRIWLTAVFLVAGAFCAVAQVSTPSENAVIAIDYYEPRDPDLLPLYQKMRQRRVLQELSQFLAAVQWPKTLRLLMKECPEGTPGPEVFYTPIEYSLTICYQWLRFLETLQPPASFATRQEVIVGGLVGIVLHEAAHAVFDMLKVSRFGAEEDAADQLASFVALQFGKDVARTVVKGTYYVWDTYDYYIRTNNKQYNYASASSVAPQRAYNMLCIAYGGDLEVFKDLVEKGLLNRVLPSARAGNCMDEYQQVAKAFGKTIAPHLNKELMRRALRTDWLLPEDLQR